MKTCGILTIGTEITDGEIVNSNASWLATQLTELGFQVLEQRSVADNSQKIQESLRGLGSQVDHLWVTGGLGPTSDDITREQVAIYVGEPLNFHEPSYQTLKKRFTEMGRQLIEGHRRQCEFPRGAALLKNPVGQAHGFVCETTSGPIVWVLPGPPDELKGIWSNEIIDRIQAWAPKTSQNLLVFRCLGTGESELAKITEEVIQNKGLQVGYRASVPYVFIKVWTSDPKQEVIQNLRAALQPYLVSEGYEDPFENLLKRLEVMGHVVFNDRASQGLLAERLAGITRKRKQSFHNIDLIWRPKDVKEPAVMVASKDHNLISLDEDPDHEGGWILSGRIQMQEFHEKIEPLFGRKSKGVRTRKYLLEQSFYKLSERLKV